MSAAQTSTAGRTEADLAQAISPATRPELYERRPQEFVGITTPTLIYVGVDNREDFDRIALPLQDNGPKDHGHVLVKTLGEIGSTTTVIFQHWLLSPTIEGYRVIDAARAALTAAKTGGEA